MEIRRIQVADVPIFLALWGRVHSEGAFIAKGPPSEERVRAIVTRVVAEEIPNFVATDSGAVIGAVEVFPGSMCGMSHEGADKIGYLGIQIDSKYRNNGIGTDLMNVALADSIRYGFEFIELTVFESNVVATCLYEKLGFISSGFGGSVMLPIGIETREKHMTLSIEHNNKNQVDA